jgi:hypothetical protein
MDTFSTRKWFRNQYLEEANLNEDGSIQTKEEAFRVLMDIEANMPKWGGQEGEFYRNQLGQAIDFLRDGEMF